MKLFDLESIRKLQNALVKRQKPKTVAIDATGIESHHTSKHYEWRIGKRYFPGAKLDALAA